MAPGLHELEPDVLGRILAHPLLDQRSRASAGAACRALLRASCLPEVWRKVDLILDLADQDRLDSLLLFLERRGAAVQQFILFPRPARRTADSLVLSQERLARLLGALPAVQELSLDLQHIARVRLSDNAARLPQLHRLGLHDEGGVQNLPAGHLTGLQNFSSLQDLELNLRFADLQEVAMGSLLRGIEIVTGLTRLVLCHCGVYSVVDPTFPSEGAWSPQVSRLQRLYEYREEGLCLKLPPDFARLPALRLLDIDCFTWQQNGGVLCALQGLTSLSLGIYTMGEIVTDPAGLKQVLNNLKALRWRGPVSELQKLGCLRLHHLTSLELCDNMDFFPCLTWSPECSLQRLVYELQDIGFHDPDYPDTMIDFRDLSSLTTLTSLTVVGWEVTRWPMAPCLALLRELKLSSTGLTCIPGELIAAAMLRLLEVSSEPDLIVGRECAATVSRLIGGQLERVQFRDCPQWQSISLEWDEESEASLRRVCRNVTD